MYRSFDPESFVTIAPTIQRAQRSPLAGQIRQDHRVGIVLVLATLIPSWALIGTAIGLI